jgi:hypothetical protein
MNNLSLIKSINNLERVESINNLYVMKTIIEHVMRTCVLRRPIVFLRVRCGICLRCSILILLIKTVRSIIVRCIVYKYFADPGCRAFSRVGLRPLACCECGFESRRGLGGFLSCECCVLSGRGISVGPISHPEKSHRLWYVWLWSRNLNMRRARPQYSRFATGIHVCLHIIIIIIIFINCNWVITRWQWLFYMYTNMERKKSN